MNDLVLFSVSR